MTSDPSVSYRRRGLILAGLCVIGAWAAGCAWFGGNTKPGWVEGASEDHPPVRYLSGVGQADTRQAASDEAYAAVARVFRAEVEAQAKDWESYLVVEQRGTSNTERRLTLDHVTKVTTEKALENVGIADTWYDSKKGLYYALAVMDRAQAETSLIERMTTLDQAIEADVVESRQTMDKLAKVRSLRRAARNLVLREAYNADLRVVRTTGQGAAAAYRVDELTAELERFLATNLVMALQIHGDHAEPVRRALTEGLLREGLQVMAEPVYERAEAPELLLRGTVRLFPIEVKDPQFTYVRWCSDFDIVETRAGRVVGAVARGGKEGHLTEREATAKALRVMQQEFSTEVAKAIAAHVFGEAALPMPAARPSGCPRSESSIQSMQ